MLHDLAGLARRVFGGKTPAPPVPSPAHLRYARAYEETGRLNLTALFAARIAALAVTEGRVTVNGGGEAVRAAVAEAWRDLRKLTARALGTGGVVLVPEPYGGRIRCAAVGQERLAVLESRGREITDAVIAAETLPGPEPGRFRAGRGPGVRLARYRLQDDGTLTISARTAGPGPEDWPGPPDGAPEWSVPGAGRMPFAVLRSPADDRRAGGPYGVPLTYGCEALAREIQEALDQTAEEFRLKQVRVFADGRLFGRPGRDGGDRPGGMEEKLFVRLPGVYSDQPLIETFSPEIRDASQFRRLDRLFGLLEKAVGTSSGILTESRSRAATATEIKAALYDTFVLVDAARTEIQTALEDYAAACALVAGNGQTAGTLTFEWSYALVESSAETFDQLIRGLEAGAVAPAEIRTYLGLG